jgi:hypothetical protein
MGVVEDVRQALQDIVAPEMREIKTRLDGLEKRIDNVDRRIDGLGQQLREEIKTVDVRVDGLGQRVDSFAQQLREEMRGMRDEILTATRSYQVQDVRERVIRLEDRQTH